MKLVTWAEREAPSSSSAAPPSGAVLPLKSQEETEAVAECRRYMAPPASTAQPAPTAKSIGIVQTIQIVRQYITGTDSTRSTGSTLQQCDRVGGLRKRPPLTLLPIA